MNGSLVLLAPILAAATLGALALGASPALAHHGGGDAPAGTLIVPAGGTASVAIAGADPGDTLQWTWTLAPTSPAVPADLLAALVWTDASGQARTADPRQGGRTFGTFVAPPTYRAARLVWHNTGGVAAEVLWTYGASAPFWSRPGVFLPALIPVFILVAAYALGAAVDARGRRDRRAGAGGGARRIPQPVTGGES